MEELRLGRKERRRMKVLEEVEQKRIALADTAAILGMSYRQASRIWLRYREQSDKGLVHRGQGKLPNNTIDQKVKKRILQRYEERYARFWADAGSREAGRGGAAD